MVTARIKLFFLGSRQDTEQSVCKARIALNLNGDMQKSDQIGVGNRTAAEESNMVDEIRNKTSQ